MAPSARTLELIAVMSESVLIGAYGVLTALVIWLLVTRRHTMPTMHKVLFGASIIMFAISVVHLELVMLQTSLTAVDQANSKARVVLSTFQFIIGDLIFIWRVWVVWGRNYWIASGPLAIMIVAASLTFDLATGKEIRTFFTIAPAALIVANTSICTMLIAGKIWYARYQLRKASGGVLHTPGGFQGTVALFIETGVLYAICHLISLILNHVGSKGIHILLNLEVPLIGILPTLIIVFVHFQLIGRDHSRSNSMLSRDINFQDLSCADVDEIASTATAHSNVPTRTLYDKGGGYPPV